jgi:hypothetical protein
MMGGGKPRRLVPALAATVAAALMAAGCGGGSGGSATPKTIDDVKSNLEDAGYKVTKYPPGEGVLTLANQGGGKLPVADAGLSIDAGPDGQKLYASVFQLKDPADLKIAEQDYDVHVVEGDLLFGISGTKPELDDIVKDAGYGGGGGGEGSSADADAAQAALERFNTDYAGGDEKAVCGDLTKQTLKKSKTFCDPASIFYKRKPDPRVRDYEISDVSVSGDTATATVTYQGNTEKVELQKQGGEWKFATGLGEGHLY